MRTFEIPACGAFLLAETTDEHQALFQNSQPMTYFSTPEELVERVRYYLAHQEERTNIAHLGHAKIIQGCNTYKDRVEQILKIVMRWSATDDFLQGVGYVDRVG